MNPDVSGLDILWKWCVDGNRDNAVEAQWQITRQCRHAGTDHWLC